MTRAIATAALVALVAACGARAQPPRRLLPDPLATVSHEELFSLGLAFERSGDSIRAEQYLTAALDRGHPAQEVIPHLLEVCLQAGRYAAAMQYARLYLKRHPEDWGVRYLLASVYGARGQTAAARAQVRRVLDARPTAPRIYALLGALARDVLGDPALAAECFDGPGPPGAAP